MIIWRAVKPRVRDFRGILRRSSSATRVFYANSEIMSSEGCYGPSSLKNSVCGANIGTYHYFSSGLTTMPKRDACIGSLIFVNHPSYFTRNTATKDAKKSQDHEMFVAGKLAMISFNPTFYQERSYESPAEFRRHQNLEEYARSLKALEAAKTKKRFRRCNQD